MNQEELYNLIKTDIEYIRGVGMTINPMTLFILCQPRKALSHC